MIEKIAVLGAGTMGAGIATLFARHGLEVSIYDPNADALRSAESKLGDEHAASLHLTDKLEAAVAGADLVMESVTENLDIKRSLYRQLEVLVKADATVTSNTSTFPLHLLAEDTAFANRMLITHFFNPAQLVPLVEVVGLPDTQPQVIEQVMQLMRRCGKKPILLNKDIHGFVANRLQAALLREALFLLEQNVATSEQIDIAVKEGIGPRWALKGMFEIADLGGLDIWAKVAGQLFPELDTSREVPELLRQKADAGEFGVKSGKGFYTYEEAGRTALEMNANLIRLLQLKEEMGASSQQDK